MKRFIVVFMLILIVRFINAQHLSQSVDIRKNGFSSDPSLDHLKNQDEIIETMFPESAAASLSYFKNEPQYYQDFGVSVVAWGSDPAYVSHTWLSNVISSAKNMGVDYISANVDVITATSEVLYHQSALRQAIAKNLNNEGITVPWFSTVSTRGIPTWIGCTNHGAYQQHIISKLKQGISAGATALHLDTPEGSNRLNFGGCFCDTCIQGFRQYLLENISEDDLTGYDPVRTDTFNYRSWLVNEKSISATYFLNRYNNNQRSDIPLIDYYEQYQNKAFADFVKHLHRELNTYAGKELLLSTNVFNLEPRSLEVIAVSDFLTNEIEHLPYNCSLPSTYALFCCRLGNALGKRIVTSCAGWEWNTIRDQNNMDLLRFWIAQSYASGNHFMIPYNQWVFSGGEQESEFYTPDINFTKPLYNFIKDNSTLFDDAIDAANIVLIFDLDTYEREYKGAGSKIFRLFKNLTDAGYTVQFAVTGSEKHQELLDTRFLPEPKLILVPDNVVMDPELNDWANEAIRKGAIKKSISYASSGYIDWTRSETAENGRVCILPRKKTTADKVSYIYHVLNTSYNCNDKTISPQTNIVVKLKPGNNPHLQEWTAKWYNNSSKSSLPIQRSENEITITIPNLSVWGILELSTHDSDETSIFDNHLFEGVQIGVINNTIHIAGVSEKTIVNVYNTVGQLIYTRSMENNTSFHLGKKVYGIHLVQLVSQHNNAYTKKVFID